MWWSGYTGSIGYVVPLWIISGIVVLLLEKKGYQRANMNKEKKVAGFLGWFNLSIGVLIYVGNMVLR